MVIDQLMFSLGHSSPAPSPSLHLHYPRTGLPMDSPVPSGMESSQQYAGPSSGDELPLTSVTDRLLRYSSEGGSIEEIKTLYNEAQASGMTVPLADMASEAARNNNVDVLKYCLELGANAKSEALMLAALASKETAPIEALLDAKPPADVNVDMDVLGSPLLASIAKRNFGQFSMLLERGADPNSASTWGSGRMRALATSVQYAPGGNTYYVIGLLSKGAEIKGSGALQRAAIKRRADLIRLLMDSGADPNEMPGRRAVNVPEQERGTALHLAVDTKADEPVIRALLNREASADSLRASPLLLDAQGRTVLERAKQRRTDEVWLMRLLHDAAGTSEDLDFAAEFESQGSNHR